MGVVWKETFLKFFVCVSIALLATKTKAMPCTMNQEPDPETGRYRWVIQAVDPCECTAIGMGGFSTFVPYRPYEVTYYDTFLISNCPLEIKKWLNCTGDTKYCSVEKPLGMENGNIPDESITSSSMWRNYIAHSPVKARLNTQGFAGAWSNDDKTDNISPWIQVDFDGTVTVIGLITQGREDGDQWVTEYQVAYSDGAQSWNHVADVNGNPIEFPGNEDRNTMVTIRYPFALRTTLMRIYPTLWFEHCSMRFEVIGCYEY